jgi:hypothetical protein
MQGNTSSGISYQLKDIYACGVAGMLLHSNSKISYQWIFNKSGTIHTTIGAGTAYHSGAPEFTPGY